MKAKSLIVVGLLSCAWTSFASDKVVEYTMPDVKAELTPSRTWPDRTYISILDNAYVQPYEPYGAPMIPFRVIQFAIPDGYAPKNVSAEVESWTTVSENVRVMPIQPPVPTNTPTNEVPEFVELDLSLVLNGPYPASPVEQLGSVEQNGINILSVKVIPFRWNAMTGKLEQANKVKVIVTFEEAQIESRDRGVVNLMLQRETRARVVNPKDLPPEPMQMMAVDNTKPIYLILAPHDLYEDWQWYAGERAKNHPEISFDVVDVDTIYEKYPYRNVRQPASGPITDLEANENRYPSESIWRWLVNYRKSNSNLKYVVLGGAWLDVTDPNVHYMQDGTEITLKNAIPSMRVKPNRKDGFYNPTDMYYACLSTKADETGHHWDFNDNGIYLEDVIDNDGEAGRTKGWPDVAVSRMTMKPIKMGDNVEFNPEFELVGGNRVLNQHQLIRNFLYKVNRAEGNGIVGTRIEDDKEVFEYAAGPFAGNYKLGITSSYLVEPACYMDNIRVLRDETEFFDRVPNMYAPEHPSAYRDTGPHMRRHVSEVAALRRPVIDAVCFHQGEIYSKNTTPQTFSQVFRNFDREIGAVNGHGWAGGTGQFNANMFAQCAGLTKINVVGISCETGYLDIYGNQNGKSVANLCLGESGMANVTKTGGLIASINNSRYGWVNWETEQLFGQHQSWRLHYWMYDGVTQGMNAGDSWLRMAQNFYNDFGYTHLPSLIPGQCYTQMMLFGDPLIAAVPIADATISGESWDVGTVEDATISTSGSKTINVAAKTDGAPHGAMSLSISQPNNATLTLAGDGGLKVMRGITVSGGKLEIGISGGQGGVGTYVTDSKGAPIETENAKRPNGLKFTSTGELTFNNTKSDAYYFVNKVENASKITFAGAGAIINTDDFDNNLNALVFQGPEGFDPRTAPANVIRANLSKNVGALTKFMPLTLTNSALTLETYDTFNGYEGDTFMTLNNSILKYRENRWRGLSNLDYCEKVQGKLYLNNSTLAVDYPCSVYLNAPEIEVAGSSSIEATHGGFFKLNGVMAIDLKNNATLTLNAKFELLQNGGLTITGAGKVIVENATGLAGNIQVGEGITLELAALPLPDVSALTLANNVRLIIPEDGDFYQVLPLSSGLNVTEGSKVTVALKSTEGVETEISAEITQTGFIFKSGSILAWSNPDGVWDGDEQYFPDIYSLGRVVNANVDVDRAVNSSFVCFANKETAYTFRLTSATSKATITFDALSIGGKTRFELPTYFKTRLYIAGGDFYGKEVKSPIVEIAAGGRFEAEEISSMNDAPAEVRVLKDGSFVLMGEHNANFVFEAGARLKAENGKMLICSGSNSFVWPESGKIVIDVSDWSATDVMTPIITGVNADMRILRHFESSSDNVTLAINDSGDVCLLKCMAVEDNWLKEGVITLTSQSETITFDNPKHYATLTFDTEIENASLILNITESGSLMTDELHFEKVSMVEVSNVKLGTGTLYAAKETHIKGNSSGVLSMTADDNVYIHTPTDPWTLAEGAKGVIYVGITDRVRAERQKIFKIDPASEWPIAGLTVKAYDFTNSAVRDDFSLIREGEWVYLVPPGIHATVNAGKTSWTDLTWYAYDNNPVTIENWDNIYAVEIVSANDAAVVVMDGAPRQDLVTSGSKLKLKADVTKAIVLPSELVVNNELTIEGAMLPTLDHIEGTGKLILETGSVTEIVIPGSIMPIEAQIEIGPTSTLCLKHQTYFQNKQAHFNLLSGTGTLEIKDISGNNSRFMVPDNSLLFASTLSFVLNTELELQRSHCDNPMQVSNLSGSGTFGYGLMSPEKMLYDMGLYANQDHGFDLYKSLFCGTRVLRTTQDRVSEWTGWFPDWYGMPSFGINFDEKLVVAGRESNPDFSRRLVYSGTASDNATLTCQGDKGADHTVTIESSGCFELNGYWNGTIENSGILVLGRRCVIKQDKTEFLGSGKIATLGNQINLITYPAFKDYTLATGTYGNIIFEATALDAEQEIMSADAFTPAEGQDLVLLAINGEKRQWQKVTASNFKNGKLVWLPGNGQETDAEIVFELSAGNENDFATLLGEKYLGGAAELTIKGIEGGESFLNATEHIGNFSGIINLQNATLKCVSPLEAKLGANPTGKLIFVVDNPDWELELMGLADNFTYDPEAFTVAVVDRNGEAVDGYWTWTAQNGILKYVLTDPKTNAYLPRAFKFDQTLSSWGSNNLNLGTPTSDKFVPSRDGYAITDHNPSGTGFEIGRNDWTVTWCARLSPTVGAIHFALGSVSGGGFALTTVDKSQVAISRWLGNQAATRLITAEVPFATMRFNHYALTYRHGLYTLYVNGIKAGSTMDVDNAPIYPANINWQFFSVYGGPVGNTANGQAGAIDDFRLYTVAVNEKMIKAIADEFKPWPEFSNPDGGEIELDVDSVDGQVYIEGSGTVTLMRQKGGSGLAELKWLDGNAKIVIENGVELIVEMSASNLTPLSGHEVVVQHGGRLVFKHAENINLTNCDLSNITGEGTVEFRATGANKSIYPPATSFASTLSFCNNSIIYLNKSYNDEDTPFKVTNLSGSGAFRYDTADSGYRWIEITQTEHTTFTGSFPKGAGNSPGHITCTITSDNEAPSNEKSVTLTPTNVGGLYKVIVDSVGCVGFENDSALGGAIMGATLVDNGLVVFSPRSHETIDLSTFNFYRPGESKIALNGNGTLKIKLNSSFILDSNPVGIIDASGTEGATGVLKLIHVVDDFEFSNETLIVAGALLDKELAVSGGWLCAASTASAGGTAWSTQGGAWTASSFNNGTGTTSGNAVSFDDAVSTTSGGLVNAVTVTVNEDVACSQMNFNSTLSSYTFTGSGSINCATMSFANDGAPVTLSGVTLTAETIELVVPTTVSVGTKLMSWTSQYSNTFTSASLANAGLALEKREDGLYVVEQEANLDDVFYQFSAEDTTYDASVLAVSPSPMTIACSLKTDAANEVLWEETMSASPARMTIGLMTGDSATKIKFVTSANGGPYSAPCGEVEVPFANKQTHTYIVTYAVVSRSSGKWTLYVDGVKVGESTDSQYAFLYNSKNYAYSHAQTTNGGVTLQDGRIYTRVLNTSEIKAYTQLYPNTPSLRRAPRILVR